MAILAALVTITCCCYYEKRQNNEAREEKVSFYYSNGSGPLEKNKIERDQMQVSLCYMHIQMH